MNMDKNEKNDILKTYTKNGTPINSQQYCQKGKWLNIFDKFLLSTPFNRPDMFYVNSKYCYMFEHFEIDASLYRAGKGSAYKRNLSSIDKQLKKKTNEMIDNIKRNPNELSLQSITLSTTQEATKENFKNNFNRIFDSHYLNITEYKENLKKQLNAKNYIYKTIFIIEQTTEFGGIIVKDGKHIDLELFYCDFVINKLKESSNVDYVIFLNKSNTKITFVENGNFKKLHKHILTYDNEYICFIDDVITLTQTYFIPNKML